MRTGGQIRSKAGKGWPAELRQPCYICRKAILIERLDWYSPEMAACKGKCSKELKAALDRCDTERAASEKPIEK